MEEVETQAKQVLLDTLTPENKSQGYADTDGTVLAEALRVQPAEKETYTVTDEKAYAQWLTENGCPDPRWETRLCESEKTQTRIAALISKTGEVPAGVRAAVTHRAPYIRTTIKNRDEFRHRISAAQQLHAAIGQLAIDQGDNTHE